MTDSLPPEARVILDPNEIFEKDADEETLGRCEVLVAWPGRAKKDLLLKLKSLKMVQSLSAGVDGLDFSAIGKDVAVFSNAGAFTEPVAEHALGLLLGIAKGIQVRNSHQVPRKLRGGTLLVIGAGAIGSEVGRLAKLIGMKTIAVSRSVASAGQFDERHGVEELPALMGRADAIAIALPLTSYTRGLIGYDLLARAKESVVVVNVGRGDTVSEDGLLRWLRERPESRYATDVFWIKEGRESFDTALWALPNFGGTLHVSGDPLGDNLLVPKVAAAKNVKLFLETGEARNRVERTEYQ